MPDTIKDEEFWFEEGTLVLLVRVKPDLDRSR